MQYSSDIKTAQMNAVKDGIDAGSGAGKLKIGTAGMATVIAVFTLNDPSGTVSGNVLTLSGFPKTVAATGTGVAAEAVITDSADNVKVSGLTVDTVDADIILDNTNINASQNVTLSAATLTHS